MRRNGNSHSAAADVVTTDPAAVQTLLEEARRTTDYAGYLKLCRARRRLGPRTGATARKVTLLGGGTTDFLAAPLALELEARGVSADVSASGYNSVLNDFLNPIAAAAAPPADVVVALPTPFNIGDWPAVGATPAEARALAERTADGWIAACRRYSEQTGAEVILGNFHALPTSPLGNLGTRLPWDRNRFLRTVNAALAERSPPSLHLLDIESLAGYHGVSAWFDERYWYHAKQPVSFACAVPLVRALAALIGATYGGTAKCVVMDLDNTLWGGVVGDDGVEGLRIGEGNAEGEAFKALQTYLKGLKDQGVLLAVSSKNEPANARAPFETLQDMVLRLDDFAAFKANWDPKPDALRQIAAELNIGLDSLVFVDDNPAEREIVRRMLPEVRVVDLGADPSDYPRQIAATGWLELARLTAEDRLKPEQYRQNRARKELETSATDYGAYLDSLEQRATIRPFVPADLDRITQLINKTNQFNLTTRRLTRAEVERIAGRADAVTATVRVADRFGDNGLISVLVATPAGRDLEVEIWLMSCRVLKRGVEQALANQLFAAAAERGFERVIGSHIPTDRNAMVADLYGQLGFELLEKRLDGTTRWAKLVAAHDPFPLHMTLSEET